VCHQYFLFSLPSNQCPMFRSVIFASLGVQGFSQLFLESTQEYAKEDVQQVYIVRHGDKYSSYPDCTAEKHEQPCHNITLMGDNAWLTPCGVKQANARAESLAKFADLKNIVVSPWARTLQTALPLAKAFNLKLKVEYLLSEAMQPDGPNFAFNAHADEITKGQLAEVQSFWDLDYGSFPIQSPEDNLLYDARVQLAATQLAKRFPPSSGDVAIVTHATTSFSVAYGLCYGANSSADMLEQFIAGQDAIGPAGMIHIVRDAQGRCVSIDQTDNSAMESADCGVTEPFRCNYAQNPMWYWPNPEGSGPDDC